MKYEIELIKPVRARESSGNVVKLEFIKTKLPTEKIKSRDYLISIVPRKGVTSPRSSLEEPKERDGIFCPYCGGKSRYLKILDKYYCFNCKRYIEH